MGSSGKNPTDGVSHEKGKRRPYAKPKLLEYGSVAKLTQSGGSTANEPATKMKGKCL